MASVYAYPFLAGKSTLGRTDMGVDFTGTGPIMAIGNARVIRTGAPGWPNGGAGPAGQGVLYKLLDGPNKGQIIYVYEGIVPKVHAGQVVKKGQVIGSFYPGSSIEIGFADASGQALAHDVYTEGDVTTWGQKMAKFLGQIASHHVTPINTAGAVGQAAGSVGSAITDIPGAIVSAIFDALGQEGARILLYIAFVLGGGGLVIVGLGRAFGIKASTVAKTAAVAV